MLNVLPKKAPSLQEYAAAVSERDERAAAKRLQQCKKCPESGGACDTPYEQLVRGKTVRWNNGLDFVWCDRWPTYWVRQKLQSFGVPIAMLGKTLDNFDCKGNAGLGDALDECRAYADEMAESGLFLFGATGVGKTHIACAILSKLFWSKRIKGAQFSYVPRFLNDLRDSYKMPIEDRREFLDRATDCDVLVLDDLGSEQTTEWVREQLGIIVNERWANGRPMIVTSNHELDRFADTLGPRAFSRMKSMLAEVAFVGSDRR